MEHILNQIRTQFEVDQKSHPASVAGQWIETPGQIKIPKYPIGRGHLDSLGPLKHGLRAEALTEHAEANNLIRVIDIALTLSDSGCNP